MEIYKNKASGKYFIYVRDTSNDTALFVNLQGNIKSLDLCLFIEETIEHNEEKLLSQGRLTKQQLKQYLEYRDQWTREEDINMAWNLVEQALNRLLSKPLFTKPEVDIFLKLIEEYQNLKQ